MANYMICDADGNSLAQGLPEHTARASAQRQADERGESVWLYLERPVNADEEWVDDIEGEEFAPSEETEPASRNYPRPVNIAVIDQWAQERSTDIEIAQAINALCVIDGDARTPDELWEEPTQDDENRIRDILVEWTKRGDIPGTVNGVYRWGDSRFRVPRLAI